MILAERCGVLSRRSSTRRAGAGRQIIPLLVLVLAGIPRLLTAQYLTRPERSWSTITTEHFDIHFPSEMAAWSQPVASRMESVAVAVNALVGNAPRGRVTVIVEDPSNVANGFAIPLLEGPVVFLWPTPPAPSPTFGAHREWGEMLAVHEYGHIAHLTVPSRNPRERWIWRFLPARIGPVARKSPAWVIEGYATYIEGKLTGDGRPYSVGRAAILREWALEGLLPSYGQLNSGAPFLGGAMRYLVGSAFLEWLAARKGEESLSHVWRRMSARVPRSFNTAFAGVYGALPDEMYGRFTVEVTEKALQVRRELQQAGMVEGEMVQHYRWSAGTPAVSPDGRLLAISVGARGKPPELQVWSTGTEPADTGGSRRRTRMLARDTLDVPAIDSFPPAKKVLARLRARAGRAMDSPRWFADGERLLVTRDEPLGDGAVRPDLFVWNFRRHSLRRVTHGAAVRFADPAPDGTSATAVRCNGGVCDLVLVRLTDGSVRVLVAGAPDVTWYRPRWSPDGTTLAAAVHRDGRWRVALVDVATGSARVIDAGDSASRYTPSFTRDGRELVLVSERGGVANLEAISLDGSVPRPLTRVLGAVLAADLSRADGYVYFTTLHAKGFDLRRLKPGDSTTSVRDSRAIRLDPALFPAAPPDPVRLPPILPAKVGEARGYGIGPRHWRLLPGGLAGPDGAMALLAVSNTDPIARLGIVAQGGYGDRGSWHGGSLAAELRSSVIRLSGAGWYTEHAPSKQRAGTSGQLRVDARYTGFAGSLSAARNTALWAAQVRGIVSGGVIDGYQMNDDLRRLASAEMHARLTLPLGGLMAEPEGFLQLSRGTTAGNSWSRGIVRGALTVTSSGRFLRGEALAGHVTAAGAADFGRTYEQFLVGGNAPPFADAAVHTERIPLPGVPVGVASGERIGYARLSLGGVTLLEPSLTFISAGARREVWQRLVAVERELTLPSLGFARLPAVRARAGLSYSIDAPYERKARAYATLTYAP